MKWEDMRKELTSITPEIAARHDAQAKLHERIENDHVFHPVKDGQGERYTAIRAAGKEFAHTLIELGVPSRELSEALTHVDAAVFFANASIARHD